MYMQLQLFVVLLFCVIFTDAMVADPMQEFEALIKQQSLESGLYNSSDKVTVLTSANFHEKVLHQNRSSLVEFYNSYCGHCKRFAPHYKHLANSLHRWRDLVVICAIDCAVEENNGICREFEVMSYPTIRYIGPNFVPGDRKYGIDMKSQEVDAIRNSLAQLLAAENRTANMIKWPNFQNITDNEVKTLFEGLDSSIKYVIVVYEQENSTTGIETILYFQRWPDIQIRRVTDSEVAAKLKMDGVHYKLARIDRKGGIVPFTTLTDSRESIIDGIERFLRPEHITELQELFSSTTATLVQEHNKAELLKTLREVKSNKHIVYQADLEMAIRGMLFNEVARFSEIKSDRLYALKRYLATLKRYNPLGSNGQEFITKLHEYVSKFKENIPGKEYEAELKRLEAEYQPIFSANQYVGCIGSQSGMRGFTCSLWKLYHYFTVQAACTDLSDDPMEVVRGMHGYITSYFGCTACARHFHEMSTRYKIWAIANKTEAILWLWTAHNDVNHRIAGDTTEDPQFPKIQFPSQSSCSECYKEPPKSPTNLNINWNRDAVLSFLKNIYNPEYISNYGLQHPEVLRPSLEKFRQKRMIGNVFSDMDMRMGMLLYGFCIVMMIVAFKLFAFKGYRKKPYGHDILGKV